MTGLSKLPFILERYEAEILEGWMQQQISAVTRRKELIKEPELRDRCVSFLRAFGVCLRQDTPADLQRKEWAPVRDILTETSRERARLGFSPSETAMFIFTLKQPLFARLRQEYGHQADQLFNELDFSSTLIDKLGLYTTEIYQKSREDVINRQAQEMLELSTPVVKLWDGVIGLPMIGTLDSNRSQIVMEGLLQAIVDHSADVAIIDITGVPTVDTLTAQHLLKAVAAARLMGAECIISGIRPQIAQTIVHLGIELHTIQTKSTLAEALTLALKYRGYGVRALNETHKH